MKPRLLILSDLWGLSRCTWITHYVELLSTAFSIQLYDSCALANVAVAGGEEAAIHSAFVQGGIDVAADNLLELEPGKVDVLAFSVGGTIAWEAALKGMHIGPLYTVASTRLRLKTAKPDCKIQLYYGADDPNQPQASWYEHLKLDPPLMVRGGHAFYADIDSATRICDAILEDHSRLKK